MACLGNVLPLMWICFTLMQDIHGGSNTCNCGSDFSCNRCKTIGCEDVTCQNNGTCQEKMNSYVCMCKDGFSGIHCENYNGDYILYWNFDTLNGLTQMEGAEPINFCPLVAGQVNYAVSTDQPQRQWIDLGSHTEACMTQPHSCGEAGGAISLWYRVISCPLDSGTGEEFSGKVGRGIITSIESFNSTGFHIYCRGHFTWFGINLQNNRHVGSFDTPNDWAHVVVNYLNPPSVKGYLNGKLLPDGSGTAGGEYKTGSQKIVVGRLNSGLDARYASAQVDELLYFNKALSEEEIRLLSQ